MGIKGKIHSLETFATMEGDGIRMGIFMCGCPYRCAYCHNPDTWNMQSGSDFSPAELLEKAERYSRYYLNGGGVTFTGGEPLMQPEFLLESIKAFKNRGYHVAIDTSGGVIPDNIAAIIELADLFIVDLKFYTDEDYKKYCGGSIDNPLELMRLVGVYGKELRLRTVILPGINDSLSDVDKYYDKIKHLRVSEYKLQGYHTMGVYKYKELGMEYRLEGMTDLDADKLAVLQSRLDSLMNK